MVTPCLEHLLWTRVPIVGRDGRPVGSLRFERQYRNWFASWWSRAVAHPSAVRSTVPSHWNFSRFLGRVVRLEDERGLVSAMIGSLRASLFEEVPDFGRDLGYDGKAIESHSTGRVGKGEEHASDPDADWGKHETSGVNGRTGAVWKKVKSWFGYGLHLIADTRYEVPVAFAVTRAAGSEARVLPGMLEDLFGKAPEMVDRGDDFSADRGLDSGPLKARLWDRWTIRPLIDTRLMWQAEKEEPGYDPERPITRPLFPSGPTSWFMTSAAGCPASAPRPARSGRCRSRASRPTAAPAARSNTAARRPPSASGARAARRATGRAE